MGNMNATTVWPLDAMGPGVNEAEQKPSIVMGGSPLQLWANLDTDPRNSVVNLRWVIPPFNLSDPLSDTAVPQVSFVSTPNHITSNNCASAGNAPSSMVVYVTCYFAC